jgi:hypothetical protein
VVTKKPLANPSVKRFRHRTRTPVDLLSKRCMLLAENVQREDLSSIEWVEAIAEMVDAELIEDPEYAALAKKPALLVRELLIKLDSNRRNGTDHFTSKFTGIVEGLFARLRKPVEWMSDCIHDLPLLKLPDPVKELAITGKLSIELTDPPETQQNPGGAGPSGRRAPA